MIDSLNSCKNVTLEKRLERITEIGLWAFALLTTLSIVLQNFLFLAMAAWLLRRHFIQKRSLGFPAWGWVWVAFIVWALAACLVAPNQWNSLMNWRKWLLAAAAWCIADAVEDGRRLRGLLGTLLLGAALVNVGASLCYGTRPLLAWAGGEPWVQVAHQWVLDNGVEWRARGGSGGYMVLAAEDTLLLLFFSGLALEDVSWRTPTVYACLAAIGLGLLLTMTRGAWLAAGLGLGVLLMWRRPRLGLLVVLGLILAVLLAPGSVFVRRLQSVGDLDNGSNRERIYMAQVGFGIMRDHPWLGVGDSLYSFEKTGPGGHSEHVTGYFLRYLTPEAVAWYKVNLPGKDNGHLHDVPLQLAAMYGLPGLGLALLFFGGLVVWGLRQRRWAQTPLARGTGLGLAIGLAAFFAHGMTEYNLGAFQSSFTLWFVVGLSVAAARLDGGANVSGGSVPSGKNAGARWP